MGCCQSCGIEAPTKYVEFYQSIGALVIRFSKSIKGELCKKCIHEYFWSMSATTLFLGPWSIGSLITSPFFLLNNIFRYLFALSLESPSANAKKLSLTDADIERLGAVSGELVDLVTVNKMPLSQAAEIIAPKAGVTPGQVMLYFEALVKVVNAKKK